MITSSLRFVKQFNRTVAKIESDVLDGAGKACEDTAEDIVEYIKAHWYKGNPPSPATGNSEPAVDTSNLDQSIKAESTGRTAGGQFARTGDSVAHFVSFNTENGDNNNGRGQYALAVNDGNRRTGAVERPYIEPAFKANTDSLINNMKDRIKIRGS